MKEYFFQFGVLIMANGNGFNLQKVLQALSLLTQLGLVILANLAVGFFLGSLLDSILHTTIIFRIIGLLLGIASGFYSVYRLVLKLIGDDESAK